MRSLCLRLRQCISSILNTKHCGDKHKRRKEEQGGVPWACKLIVLAAGFVVMVLLHPCRTRFLPTIAHAPLCTIGKAAELCRQRALNAAMADNYGE
jgi:hypothetical protein